MTYGDHGRHVVPIQHGMKNSPSKTAVGSITGVPVSERYQEETPKESVEERAHFHRGASLPQKEGKSIPNSLAPPPGDGLDVPDTLKA